MQAIILDLTMFQLVLSCVTRHAYRAASLIRSLHSVTHLRIIVNVCNNKDLSHLEDDQELHWYELVEEEVEGKESLEGLLGGILSIVEQVLA